ncbi:MAG: PQQ-dependent sugar dehydrogenase [Sphingomonadaceae bacterium]
MKTENLLPAILPLALGLASCGAAPAGDNASASPKDSAAPFAVEEMGMLDAPWAMAFVPGTEMLVITSQKGSITARDADGNMVTVSGAPTVDYGGQGGLGDIAFLESEAAETLTPRTIYLTWAEAGEGDTRGAALGRGMFVCEGAASCEIRDMEVIWRQQPKVSGRGHYSHRIAISADESYLWLASGDRQKMQPAQDLSNTLGTVLRLTLDGEPAPGNPFADRGSPSDEIWSYGHRNILGLAFDPQGRLWDLEHGPAGGDELNLVKQGANYGWPVVSDGVHYNGDAIPDHSTRPEFAKPAISWNPVIAPGDMIFYTGGQFADWQGQVLIAAMKPAGIVRVEIDGESAREVARYPMTNRIRSIEQGPDGAIWLIEDGRRASGGEGQRLLKLTPE